MIDFEYAGFGTAMFDLAGVASNAGFDADQAEALLTAYFGAPPSMPEIRRKPRRHAVRLAAARGDVEHGV